MRGVPEIFVGNRAELVAGHRGGNRAGSGHVSPIAGAGPYVLADTESGSVTT